MKHPLYSDAAFVIAKQINTDIESVKKAYSIVRSMPEYRGVRDDNVTGMLFIKALVLNNIMKNGHTYIDPGKDSWYSDISFNTIMDLKLENFKFPFKHGYIKGSSKTDIFFSYFEKGKLVDSLSSIGMDTSLPNFNGNSNFSALTISLKTRIITLISELTIRENIELYNNFNSKKDVEENIMTVISEVLSVLLYVGTYHNNDKSRCSISKQKGIKSASKGIKKHTVNVIKLFQPIKNDTNDKDGSNWKSNKRWIVRGHWRNQYYKSTDSYKPKWIDPYWKGDGNEEVKKIYKLSE